MFLRMSSSEADVIKADELMVVIIVVSSLSSVAAGIVILRYLTMVENTPSGIMSEVSISRSMAGVRTA